MRCPGCQRWNLEPTTKSGESVVRLVDTILRRSLGNAFVLVDVLVDVLAVRFAQLSINALLAHWIYIGATDTVILPY
jgi:hypothetical protein